jgi:hypothetical protein
MPQARRQTIGHQTSDHPQDLHYYFHLTQITRIRHARPQLWLSAGREPEGVRINASAVGQETHRLRWEKSDFIEKNGNL